MCQIRRFILFNSGQEGRTFRIGPSSGIARCASSSVSACAARECRNSRTRGIVHGSPDRHGFPRDQFKVGCHYRKTHFFYRTMHVPFRKIKRSEHFFKNDGRQEPLLGPRRPHPVASSLAGPALPGRASCANGWLISYWPSDLSNFIVAC